MQACLLSSGVLVCKPVTSVSCVDLWRQIYEVMRGLNAANCKRIPIIAISDLQETSDSPCDTGHPAHLLEAEFPEVDFNNVAEDWFNKRAKWNYSTADRCSLLNLDAAPPRPLPPHDLLLLTQHSTHTHTNFLSSLSLSLSLPPSRPLFPFTAPSIALLLSVSLTLVRLCWQPLTDCQRILYAPE